MTTAVAIARDKGQEVPLPVIVERGVSRLDVEKLEYGVRGPVRAFDRELRAAYLSTGKSMLRMGKALAGLQEILEPLKLFTQYLNTLSWSMASATAYRYIAAYRRANEQLTPAVVERAVALGVPLFSTSADRPFGKLTETVATMPKPPKDEAGAEKWIAELWFKHKAAKGKRIKLSDQERLENLCHTVAEMFVKQTAMPFDDWIKAFNTLVRSDAETLKKERAASHNGHAKAA